MKVSPGKSIGKTKGADRSAAAPFSITVAALANASPSNGKVLRCHGSFCEQTGKRNSEWNSRLPRDIVVPKTTIVLLLFCKNQFSADFSLLLMFKIKIKIVNTFDGGVALIHKRWCFIFYICKVFRLYCTSGFLTPEQSTCALIFETIESREGTISILKDKGLYV